MPRASAAALAAEAEDGEVTRRRRSRPSNASSRSTRSRSQSSNKKLRNVRITAKDGTLYLIHYEKKGAPAIQFGKLKPPNVSYTVIKPQGKKSKHLRLIIGIIVVVLIVAGVIAFFVRRRTRLAD